MPTTELLKLLHGIENRSGHVARAEVTFVHLCLTVNAAWISFILYMPGSTFATTRSWAWFGMWASENWWATLFAIQAFAGLVSLITRNRDLATVCLIFVCVVNGILPLGIMQSSVLATGWGTYAIHTVMSYWVLYHLRYPARLLRWFW